MAEPLIVAVVGAESTGKTALAEGLAEHLAATTRLRCTWVPETLRDWCDRHGRTPARHEQRAIAERHSARIDDAAAGHDVVIADTTALVTAVYSRIVFGDDSLDLAAVRAHARCRVTLLTAIDLPWVADGHQRDGEHVREPVDARLRELMTRHDIAFSLVCGAGPRRLQAAVAALAPWLDAATEPPRAEEARWRAWCERCGDASCEHAALLRR